MTCILRRGCEFEREYEVWEDWSNFGEKVTVTRLKCEKCGKVIEEEPAEYYEWVQWRRLRA